MRILPQVARVAILMTIFFTVAASPSAWADSATYTYDALGRLIQVSYDNGTVVIYSYDAAGNCTGQVVTCGGAGC